MVEVDSEPNENEDYNDGLFLDDLNEALEDNVFEDAPSEMQEALAQLGAMVHNLMDQKIDLTAKL